MTSNKIQKIFQTIQKKVRCPHCGRQYSFENIHILSSTGSICFLKLECGNHMPMLASVAMSSPRIENVACSTEITANNVLDVHEKLSKAKNIKELFD